jgi:16S rRNA (guanine966-N2)-methyltransferase
VPEGTRPLSDRGREGLFSSLGDSVRGAACADLFAGTGAMGIEALSRGAESCLFVESSPEAIRAIHENLDRTGLDDRARVIRSDAARGLEREKGPFDLVLVDPPYEIAEERLEAVLGSVADRIASDGQFVLTRPKGRDSTDVIPLHWRAARLLKYGDARILVCRRQD